ncbi:BLUF domain-containing protein [Brevundimonas sp. UBA7534]|uniref:BLUF domain-containing protein n=1 Tax=Brevundimonas sp. UBA7534 TaxID=1946138 RepID=UPI0025BB2B03|nr:BLUF domain-containing protein [Brevundimonas sp. UBA7534]
MKLFRVVYVSRAAEAVSDGLMPLIDIIGVSDRNNRRDHLTGALMRHQGFFIQAIEGARGDLDRLIGRLRQDRRHLDLRILADRPVESRGFPDCAMVRLDAPPAASVFLDDHLEAPDAADRAEALLVQASRSIAVTP